MDNKDDSRPEAPTPAQVAAALAARQARDCAQAPAEPSRVGLPCPTPRCEMVILKPNAAVCGCCWSVAAGMCLGKIRLQDWEYALSVQERTGCPAYQCDVCDNYHNGNTVGDATTLSEKVRRVLEGMRAARGAQWVLDLAASWAPGVEDRERWRAMRAARASAAA